MIEKITQDNVSRTQASEILKKTLETIEKALAEGDHVKISSFGTFSILQKKERAGRNPRTGEGAKISSRKVISFRASPVFKKSIGTK